MDNPSLLRQIVLAIVGRRISYAQVYSATVASQSGDMVDVTFDDAEVFPGVCRVPIYAGTPGVRADIPSGSKVLIGFISGDLKSPYALGWQCLKAVKIELKTSANIEATADASVKIDGTELDLCGNSKPIARQDDVVQAGMFVGKIVGPCSTKVKTG